MPQWRELFVGRQNELNCLQAAWLKAKLGNPKLIAIVAESGFGKTRVVQQFYNWLSIAEDGIGGAGYWPDVLLAHQDNLMVSPNAAECQTEVAMPFLWLGIRANNPGGRNQSLVSAIWQLEDNLKPHLISYTRAAQIAALRRQQVAARSWDATDLGLAAAGLIPGLDSIFSLIGTAKTLVAGAADAARIEGEIADIRERPLDPGTALAERRRSIVDLAHDDLRIIMHAPPEGMHPLPLVLFIDDAQWLGSDPNLPAFLARIMESARREGWPLLTIVTSWEREWHAPSPAGIRDVFASFDVEELSLNRIDDLRPLVQAAFPGLAAAQVDALLARADGNAQFLVEMLRHLESNPGYFVDRNCRNPLTDDGLEQVRGLPFEGLVANRLRSTPKHVQTALGLASLQGMRFAPSIVVDSAARLAVASVDQGIAQAENPHAFVSRVDIDGGEFRATYYHSCARENLVNLIDLASAEAALREALEARQVGPGEAAATSISSLESQVTLLESSVRSQRLVGFAALSQLVRDASARADYATALTLAERWAEAWEEETAAEPADFATADLWAIVDALLLWRRYNAAEAVARFWAALAERHAASSPTVDALRDHSVSLIKVGDALRDRGKSDEALRVHRQSLDIAEKLAAQLGTPEALRDHSISLNRVGDVLKDQGERREALRLYRQSLDIAEDLAAQLGTPEALRDHTMSLERVGDVLRDQGEHGEALRLHRQSLGIRERLAAQLGTPEALRDQGASLNKVGDALRDEGERGEALRLYRQSLDIAEKLAAQLGMPDTLRDHSISLNKVGDALRDQGERGEALRLYRQSLDIAEKLAAQLGTPEALRDHSISLERIGDILKDQGERSEALRLYRQSLGIREKLAAQLGTPEALRDHSVSLERVGDVLRDQGERGEALRLHRQSLGIREKLAAQLDTPKALRDHTISLERVGDVLRDQGERDEALRLYRQSLGIRERLTAQLGTPEALRDHSISLHRVGDALRDEGERGEALRLHRQSLGIRERLAAQLGTPEALRDQSTSLNKVGDALREQGKRGEALRLYRQSLDIAEKLAARLGTPEALRDHSISLERVGDILKDQGERSEALRLYRQSLRICEMRANREQTVRALADAAAAASRIFRISLRQFRLLSAYRALTTSLSYSNKASSALVDRGWTLRDILRAMKTGTTPDVPLAAVDEQSAGETLSASTGAAAAEPMASQPKGPAIITAPDSRNAACPCGSGKRYKHCHGALA